MFLMACPSGLIQYSIASLQPIVNTLRIAPSFNTKHSEILTRQTCVVSGVAFSFFYARSFYSVVRMPRVLLSPFASSLLLSLKYDNPHAPGLTFPRDLDDMARRRAVARILPYVHSLDRSLGNADSLSAAMPFVSLNRPRCTKAMTEFASSLLG